MRSLLRSIVFLAAALQSESSIKHLPSRVNHLRLPGLDTSYDHYDVCGPNTSSTRSILINGYSVDSSDSATFATISRYVIVVKRV